MSEGTMTKSYKEGKTNLSVSLRELVRNREVLFSSFLLGLYNIKLLRRTCSGDLQNEQQNTHKPFNDWYKLINCDTQALWDERR